MVIERDQLLSSKVSPIIHGDPQFKTLYSVCTAPNSTDRKPNGAGKQKRKTGVCVVGWLCVCSTANMAAR